MLSVPKRASSRAQCVLYFTFFFENRRPHAGATTKNPSKRETKKKARPKATSRLEVRWLVFKDSFWVESGRVYSVLSLCVPV